MSVLANIVITAFFLENDDFVAFHEGTFYLANDFCPFYGGRAYFNGTVGVNEENAVKLNGFAFLALVAEIMNVQELAGLSAELLSLDFYDSVHLIV